MSDRVRVQDLAIDVLAFGQGVPFYHAGVELLRSKSLDRNSYNSGDWFNRLDLSCSSNNFGVGLPPEPDNGADWALMKPILADPARKPAQADIEATLAHFEEALEVRRSSRLFRLTSAAEVEERLTYYNTGVDQVPGLIVMRLTDDVNGEDIDPSWEDIVVLINASPDEVEYTDLDFAAASLSLHPVQAASADPVVRGSSFALGTFTVPGRTSAVFVGRVAPL
jgi:pullulanase/glycogen debranching enzyme